MSDSLVLKGELKGHENWVTSIATTEMDPDMILSGSRDKSVIVWKLTHEQDTYGVAAKRLTGHAHFVQDVTISSDAAFALTGSWDTTLRLWDLSTGETSYTFVGHEKDVLSVAFNADNTKIVSGSRDKTIKLWNVLGQCKYTLTDDGHTDWVSCVRFSPAGEGEVIVSCGWDKLVKVWDLTSCKLLKDLVRHTGCLNTVTVSPDGSLCASGGKDGMATLWDLAEGQLMYSLEANAAIQSLVFSPNRYWLCAATTKGIKIWDLESKSLVVDVAHEFEERGRKALEHYPTSVAWSADGTTLFVGYTDNVIRVYGLASEDM